MTQTAVRLTAPHLPVSRARPPRAGLFFLSPSWTPTMSESAATERERTAETGLSRQGRESARRLIPSSLSWISLMNSIFVSAAAVAAARSVTPAAASSSDAGVALVAAAKLLLADLERGRVIDAHALRAAMIAAFGGSDAEGAWAWETAYQAREAAPILLLRQVAP